MKKRKAKRTKQKSSTVQYLLGKDTTLEHRINVLEQKTPHKTEPWVIETIEKMTARMEFMMRFVDTQLEASVSINRNTNQVAQNLEQVASHLRKLSYIVDNLQRPKSSRKGRRAS